MGGRCTHSTKVFGSCHNASSKMMLPHPIDDDSGRERVVLIC